MKSGESGFYDVDFPVLLSHARINGGTPVSGRLTAVQKFGATIDGERAIESFDGCLELPQIHVEDVSGEGSTAIGPLSLGVRLTEPVERGPLLGDLTAPNRASFRGELVEGAVTLAISLPFDGPVDFEASGTMGFTCILGRKGLLYASASGVLQTGTYAGMVLACCGMKTPAPPKCTVSIAVVPGSATVTRTGPAAIAVAGLAATAVSSLGHTFVAGNLVAGVVNIWRNGVRHPRAGGPVPTITAGGAITVPNFAVRAPTAIAPLVKNDVITLKLSATDAPGHTGSNELAHTI